MRTIIAHSAIIASTSAISIESIAAPDAFGPNGLNYSNNAASIDMSKISIDITEQGNGNGDKNEVCRDGQWAKIAYKAFLSNGNQVMGNDDFSGKDLIFTVGASQTFKCLDLAITQLKPGAKATIKCPSEFVYGGVATPAPLGGEPIPVDSDMSFEVDVNFCNHNPGGQDGGLYWGNDLTFGPLKPNTCVKIQGAR
jgi:FKBP-type peptidyl-prolyl cis-trans isomerase